MKIEIYEEKETFNRCEVCYATNDNFEQVAEWLDGDIRNMISGNYIYINGTVVNRNMWVVKDFLGNVKLYDDIKYLLEFYSPEGD